MIPTRNDIPSAMVVFLIALPLSMGIAIASGVPPALGLATAVIGGLVVGTLGGAHLQVSGPSAGLTVLVLEMVGEHGLATFAAIVLVAGALQLLAGGLKLGRYFQAVSPEVIRGMLAGIGILIIASQLHVMVDASVHESGRANILALPSAVAMAMSGTGEGNHGLAGIIGLGTLAVILGWERFKPASLKILPGPLVGVVLGAGLAAALGLDIKFVSLPESIAGIFTFATGESFKSMLEPGVLMDGFALAFVASAETLLCATAVARMHNGPRPDYDRELAANGLANMICGAVGVLPMTGVISRSTANVQAGAESRFSAIMHAVLIASMVLLAPQVLALVPMSCLAAILIYVGYKLINPTAIKELASYGTPVIGILAATVGGIVLVDLLFGIMLGLVLSSMKLMYRMSHIEFNVVTEGDRIELHMHGAATFLALPALTAELEAIPPGKELHIYFDELTFIDHACIDLLNAHEKRYIDNGGVFIVEWDELMHRYQSSGRPVTQEAPRLRRSA